MNIPTIEKEEILSSTLTPPRLGSLVTGYEVPVVNERAVRAGAGLLLLGGSVAFGLALAGGTQRPLQPFGMYVMFDMLARVTLGDRWSPTLALGRLIVARQRPEWVGASQKQFAWWLGFGMALAACSSMGVFSAPLWVTLALCGTCLTLLYLETAFGICVGCSLQRLLTTTAPQYCPGDTCDRPN